MNTGKFVEMRPAIFWGHKNKAGDCRQSIALDRFPF